MDVPFSRTPLGYCYYYFQFEQRHREDMCPHVHLVSFNIEFNSLPIFCLKSDYGACVKDIKQGGLSFYVSCGNARRP